MAMPSVRGSVTTDLRRGLGQSPEDLVIAALVMSPFALTLGVFAGWLTWAPSAVLILFTLGVEVVATIWNAGWRAEDPA
jgi:hypothetical protein